MSKGFWGQLEKPFFVLAPLANVTDAAFRHVTAKYGKPDVFFTEFVSADGLVSPGRNILLNDLIYTEGERPIVAQLFGSREETTERAAALMQELGFDGLDINMGCPDKAVERQGAGAALMKSPATAQAIIRAAQRGAPNLPISVKTRIGYNKDELDTWLPTLLEAAPVAITIHARTRKEMSKVAAHWDIVKRAVAIRDEKGSDALILGNGDVRDIADAHEKARASGADGIMLGRAIFGNPWLFSNDSPTPTVEEKLRVMLEHTRLFEALFTGIKSFAVMKKHYKAYMDGFPGAKELRVKLMGATSAQEVTDIVALFLG